MIALVFLASSKDKCKENQKIGGLVEKLIS
jgi:hypothetical protein